mgnify:CR=1 FL=1
MKVKDEKFFITEKCLQFLLEAAGNFYPNEFVALLSEKDDDSVLREIYMIPNTIYGDTFSSLDLWMVPIGIKATGSVHSHPGESFAPSQADLNFFEKYTVNLIVKKPYKSIEDVAAYDRRGKRANLCIKNEF